MTLFMYYLELTLLPMGLSVGVYDRNTGVAATFTRSEFNNSILPEHSELPVGCAFDNFDVHVLQSIGSTDNLLL